MSSRGTALTIPGEEYGLCCLWLAHKKEPIVKYPVVSSWLLNHCDSKLRSFSEWKFQQDPTGLHPTHSRRISAQNFLSQAYVKKNHSARSTENKEGEGRKDGMEGRSEGWRRKGGRRKAGRREKLGEVRERGRGIKERNRDQSEERGRTEWVVAGKEVTSLVLIAMDPLAINEL